MTPKQQIRTVLIFTKLNTKRFFRDTLALFFGILFPLIFLFVFGALSGNGNNVSFDVAIVDNSHTKFADSFTSQIKKQKVFKVDDEATSMSVAREFR